MLRAPYVKGRATDEYLDAIVARAKKALVGGEDDCIVVCFGTAGTGKTTIMFHAYDYYAAAPKLSRVALTRKDFAKALFSLTGKEPDPFVGYDEANVSKRESLTQWNRDIIDVYLAIRGKGALHWWNNPVLDYMERTFIEERVKFFVFCFSKSKSVRRYWLFTKDNMLRMLDKEGDLKTYTVRKVGERYASYEGWFLPYRGALWEEYKAKKEDRMDEKLVEFHSKYGLEDAQSLMAAAARIGCRDQTLKKAVVWAADAGKIVKGVDFVLKGSRWLLTSSGVEKMREVVAEKPYSSRYAATGGENAAMAAPTIFSREGDGGAGPLGRRRRK